MYILKYVLMYDELLSMIWLSQILKIRKFVCPMFPDTQSWAKSKVKVFIHRSVVFNPTTKEIFAFADHVYFDMW